MTAGVASRQLHVLRHAKSDWHDDALRDHDRPLSPRGRRALPLIAEHLINWSGPAIELVLSSTSQRTRQTVEGIVERLPGRPDVEYDDDLYLATASELIGRLRMVPAAVQAVLVCGHNPGLHHLAVQLAEPGDGRRGVAFPDHLPTAGLLTLEVSTPWAKLGPGTGTLVSFVSPKSLDPRH